MVVAGYFLIQGLSEFSGTGAISNMLIIGGILFQITESICFISASALTYHSMRWRYILFSLGIVLFGFSIAVMTLAQKTALQTGETQAKANDEKRDHVRSQIVSLQKVIDSYRFNAERQSKSIYKDSRAKGQDSLNRAALLEEKKILLSNELFSLNKSRRETSSDFFKRVESVLGLPAASTEFYFLVLRSLLLELSAIILMSFAANLRAYNKLVIAAEEKTNLEIKESMLSKALSGLDRKVKHESPISVNDKQEVIPQQASTESVVGKYTSDESRPLATQAEKPAVKGQSLHKDYIVETERDSESDYEAYTDSWESADSQDVSDDSVPMIDPKMNDLVTAVVDMYECKVLKDLSSDSIKEGVDRYLNQKLTPEKAGILSKLASNRLDQPC